MNLKEWRESSGVTKTELATSISNILKRTITANHVSAWERGSMPGWDVGEAISVLTCGRVKGESIGRAVSKTD